MELEEGGHTRTFNYQLRKLEVMSEIFPDFSEEIWRERKKKEKFFPREKIVKTGEQRQTRERERERERERRRKMEIN